MKWFVVFLALCFRIACYLGIGALCHAVVLGTHFDTSSLLSWGWLLAWPFCLLVLIVATLGVMGVAGVLLFLIGAVIFGFYSKFQAKMRRRRGRNMANSLRRSTSQR